MSLAKVIGKTSIFDSIVNSRHVGIEKKGLEKFVCYNAKIYSLVPASIIISDGNSKEKEEDINDLITESEEMNITIVTLLLTRENNNINAFYNEFPNNITTVLTHLQSIANAPNLIFHLNLL